MEVRSDQIEPPPKLGVQLKTEFIEGMAKVEENLMILLNIDRVFNSDEMGWLQDASQPTLPEELELAEA